MNSDMFKLKLKDWIDGAISAIIVAVIVGLKGIVLDSHFSFFTADWLAIGHQVSVWASAAFLGYIGNIFLSDKDGKVLGVGPASK